MKKAFIDQILFGFILFSGIFIFIATVNDDTTVRNKYNNLKDLTDNAALFAANHYNINQETIDAETLAKEMLNETDLGLEIVDNIEFIWDFDNLPNSVIARITNYQENLFWYRLLSLNSFNFENIKSKANIVKQVLTNTLNFAPLAINNCNRNDLTDNNELTFEFHSYSEFLNEDLKAFYGVTSECTNPSGNSFFAHYKNIFNNPSFDENNNFFSDYSLDVEESALCLPETDFQNPNTVDPKQLYDKLSRFPVGSRLQIALLNCNSLASDIDVSELINVELVSAPTCTQGNWTNSENFLNRVWNQESDTCNGGNYDYKLLTLDLKIIHEYKVILEY